MEEGTEWTFLRSFNLSFGGSSMKNDHSMKSRFHSDEGFSFLGDKSRMTICFYYFLFSCHSLFSVITFFIVLSHFIFLTILFSQPSLDLSLYFLSTLSLYSLSLSGCSFSLSNFSYYFHISPSHAISLLST